MNRLTLRSASLALLVALGAGLAAGLLPGRSDTPTDYDTLVLEAAAAAEPGDRVAAAIDGVREDGLHVAPELADQLTEQETDDLEQAVAGSPVPLHVVWWESTYDGGPANDYAAMAQMRAGVGEEGYYAVVSPGRPPVVDALGLEEPYVTAEGLGRPAVALRGVVEELAAAPPEPLLESSSDYWGGRGGGIAAGLLFVALGYGALVPVVWVLGRTVGRMRR